MARKKGFNKGKVTKIKMPTAGAWLTNVGKSFGLSAMDVLTSAMPATSELVGNAVEYASDFKTHMEELRNQKTRMYQAMDKSIYMDIIRTAKHNAIEDFKRGNFYTPMEYDDGFGDDDMDFDFDDDFDVGADEDYDADFASADGTTSVSTSHSSDGDVDINRVNVKVDMDKVTDAVNRQTQVSIDASQIALEYDKAFNKNLLAEITSGNKTSSSLLGSIDSNISTMVSASQTIAQASSVAMKYYDDSMSVFNSINESLTAIKTSIVDSKSMVGDASRYEGKDNNVVDDVFSSNGILDLKAYAGLVKKQAKSAVSNNLILSTIMSSLSDTDSLAGILKHPLNFVTTGIINKVIPKVVRESASAFDETLQNTMITALHKVRGLKNSDNPILKIIGETFGIGNKLKTDVDKSNYNKGKMDWNGESHKTLNEVIPYYLRRIAAAVTGTEEMAFDYNTGKFDKLSKIRENYKEDDERALLRDLSGTMSDMRTLINDNVTFLNKDDKETVEKSLKQLMVKFAKTDGASAYRKNDSFTQFVADMIASGNSNDMTAQLIGGVLDSLPRAQVMRLFGVDTLNTRNSYTRHKMQEETGQIATNVRYVDDGTFNTNEFLKEGKTKGTFDGINYKVSPFVERDKYGKSPNKYLRDIYQLLVGGIITYPQLSFAGGNVQSFGADNDRISVLTRIASTFGNDYEEGYHAEERRSTQDNEGSFNNRVARGMIGVSSLNGDADGTAIRLKSLIGQKQADETHNDARPIDRFFKKLNSILEKPSLFLKDIFDVADRTLFDLVFGSDKDSGGSLATTAMAYIKDAFSKFYDWANEKIFSPLEEKLFGDNGIFTKIEQSQFMKGLKSKMSGFGDFLFGTKNADGRRTGGLFSETANSLSDLGKETKEYLVGKGDDSILSNIKRVGGSITDEVLGIFGTNRANIKAKKESGNYHPIKDAMESISIKLKTAGNMAVDSIFGSGAISGNVDEYKEGLKKDFNSMSKGKWGSSAVLGAVAIPMISSTSGLIGSFFLPGGPIGGALLGMGIGFARHSDTIMNALFGKINNDGIREGGVISKDLSNAFIDNKKGLVAGGLAGLAASFGLIPSLFLPGGPIGGAMIGMATSMAFKSDAMQNFLFGQVGEDGERSGGVLSKAKGMFKNALGVTGKDRLLDIGAGAGLGLIGGAFLGGPILGTILGSAAGFAAGSEKVQDFIFGKPDGDGKRSGGMISRAAKKVSDIVLPFIKESQNKLLGFLERGIMIPLMTGLRPIINFGANMVKGIAEKASNMFKFIGNSVKEFLVGDESTGKKGILSPLLNIGKFMFKTVSKVSESILSAPFKLLAAIGKTLDLGSRIRNLLSPLIDGVIGGTLLMMKTAVGKVASTLTNAIKSMILAPFKIIKSTLGGVVNFFLGKKDKETGVRNGGLLGFARNTAIGKAAGNLAGRLKILGNASHVEGGGIKGLIASGGTKRMKWQRDENGKLYFGIDKSYEWNPTGIEGLTVKQDQKNRVSESRAWEDFKNAAGKGRGAAKARRKLEKQYGQAKVKEMLDNSKELLKDRSKFADSIGFGGLYSKEKSKAYQDRVTKAEQEINAKRLTSDEVEMVKVKIKDLEVVKSNLDNLNTSFNNNKHTNFIADFDRDNVVDSIKSLLEKRKNATTDEERAKIDAEIKEKKILHKNLVSVKHNTQEQNDEISRKISRYNKLIGIRERSLLDANHALFDKTQSLINNTSDTEVGNSMKSVLANNMVNVVGKAAHGSTGVPRTGLYLLSKNEQIIPNDPDQQVIDARNERNFIKNKLFGKSGINILGNYAFGTKSEIYNKAYKTIIEWANDLGVDANYVRTVSNKLLAKRKEADENYQEAPTRAFNAISEAENVVIPKAKTGVSRLGGFLKRKGKGLFSKAFSATSSFMSDQRDVVADDIRGMREAVVEIAGEMREEAKERKEKRKSLFQKAKDKLKQAGVTVKNAVAKNPITGGIGKFLFGANAFKNLEGQQLAEYNDIPESKVFKKYGFLGGTWKFLFGNDKAEDGSYASKGLIGKIAKFISDFANETFIGRIIKTGLKVAGTIVAIGALSKIWNNVLKEPLKSLKDWTVNLWTEKVFPFITNVGSKIWDAINDGMKSLLGDKWDSMKETISVIPTTICDFIDHIKNPEEGTLLYKLKSFFEDMKESYKNGTFGEFLKDNVVKPVWDNLVSCFQEGWNVTYNKVLKPLGLWLGEVLSDWWSRMISGKGSYYTEQIRELAEGRNIKNNSHTITEKIYNGVTVIDKRTGQYVNDINKKQLTQAEYNMYASNKNYYVSYDSVSEKTKDITVSASNPGGSTGITNALSGNAEEDNKNIFENYIDNSKKSNLLDLSNPTYSSTIGQFTSPYTNQLKPNTGLPLIGWLTHSEQRIGLKNGRYNFIAFFNYVYGSIKLIYITWYSSEIEDSLSKLKIPKLDNNTVYTMPNKPGYSIIDNDKLDVLIGTLYDGLYIYDSLFRTLYSYATSKNFGYASPYDAFTNTDLFVNLTKAKYVNTNNIDEWTDILSDNDIAILKELMDESIGLDIDTISNESVRYKIVTDFNSNINNLITSTNNTQSTQSNLISDAKELYQKSGQLHGNEASYGGSGKRHKSGGTGHGFGDVEFKNGFPYYSQNDPSYKNSHFGLSEGYGPDGIPETIGARGCGPTAMAMVASKIKGGYGSNPYTPENMATLAEQGNYSTNMGTSPRYFTDVGTSLGMNVTPAMATPSNINLMLSQGQPVIIQGQSNDKSSPFTRAGHYVVGVGYDKNGDILVNDPRGKSKSKSYSLSQLTKDAGMMWGFSGGYGENDTDLSQWLDVVKAVKAAIAETHHGYSNSRTLQICINGKKLMVRPDCSGFACACLHYYGVLDGTRMLSSKEFSDTSNTILMSTGFTPMPFTSFRDCKPGDIVSRRAKNGHSGHVEIFAGIDNGTCYVYNCGGPAGSSNDSTNEPGVTTDGINTQYEAVWRPGPAGKAAINSNGYICNGAEPPKVTTTASKSSKISSISDALGKFVNAVYSPIKKFLFGDDAEEEVVTTNVTSSDYDVDPTVDDIPASTIAAINMPYDKKVETAWKYFRQQGLSKAATAAILGNIYGESNFDTNASGDGGTSIGIAQWHEGRANNLKNFAASKGKPWQDYMTQLEFLNQELSGLNAYFNPSKSSKNYNLIYQNHAKVGSIPIPYEQWRQSANVDMATRQFEAAFERAGSPNITKRIGAAQGYYNNYASKAGYGGFGDVMVGNYKPSNYGYGNYNINKTLDNHDRRVREYDEGGFGNGYDDTSLKELMTEMLTEMRGTNSGIDKFNKKEFSNGDTYVIDNTNNVNVNSSKSPKKAIKVPSTMVNGKSYEVAKKIASGKIVI